MIWYIICNMLWKTTGKSSPFLRVMSQKLSMGMNRGGANIRGISFKTLLHLEQRAVQSSWLFSISYAEVSLQHRLSYRSYMICPIWYGFNILVIFIILHGKILSRELTLCCKQYDSVLIDWYSHHFVCGFPSSDLQLHSWKN